MNCWVKISQTEVNGKNEVNLTRRNPTRLPWVFIVIFSSYLWERQITILSLTKLWLGDVGGA